MKVIINADDLGASLEVNDAVFHLMAIGRVTSATLLANGAALTDAAVRSRSFPQCSFGVHLNASQWQPITHDTGLRPILDDAGCFAGDRLREVYITSALRAALFREWCAQVERVQSANVRVSHLDSHHHMHTVPKVFPVLKQVQRRFGIRRVRQTMNIYAPDKPATRRLLASKALWNWALRNYFATATTDGFTSLEMFHRSAARLGRNYTVVELMVHPGREAFMAETALLTGEWWRDLPFPIQIMSYNDL
jgi:predicted glycoside hydrolase/deacetylase ChbG (UPF0249 family)